MGAETTLLSLPPIELPALRTRASSDASDGCSHSRVLEDDFNENMAVSHLFKCKIYSLEQGPKWDQHPHVVQAFTARNFFFARRTFALLRCVP